MKLKFLIPFAIAAGFTVNSVQAQVKKSAKTIKANTNHASSATTIPKVFQLTNAQDSLSYALGIDIANSLKESGFELNIAALTEALSKKLKNQPTLIEDNNTSSIISSAMIEMRSKPGREFLEKNKERAEVLVTPEGLQYEVIEQGTGAYPLPSDEVTVQYKGTLIDGTVFDSSYDRNEPFTFKLDRVIQGWKLGIPLMRIGSKYKFYIPYTLAYGERATGAIPAFSTLIFEIELLGIKKNSEI